MRILNIIKYLLFALSIIFIFINWKLAIALFIISSIVHVIPIGPNPLLSVITGYFMIGGVIYLFISWKIGIGLIIGGFLVTKYRHLVNEYNYNYYEKIKKSNIGGNENSEDTKDNS